WREISTGLAQMKRVRANVAEFKHPIFPELALYCKVPLLRIGCDELARHYQAENCVRRNARTAAPVRGGLSRVIGRSRGTGKDETLESCETWNKRRINDPCLRQCVDVWTRAVRPGSRGEKRAQTILCAGTECYGQERRLEAKLVRRANILANVINAVSSAQCCCMVPK